MATQKELKNDVGRMSQPIDNGLDELSRTLRFPERAYSRFFFIVSALFVYIAAFLIGHLVLLNSGEWLYALATFACISALSFIPLGLLAFNACFFEISPEHLAYLPWFGRPRIIQWHHVDSIVAETSSHGGFSLKIVDINHNKIFPDIHVPDSGKLFGLIFGHLSAAGKLEMLEKAFENSGLKLKKREEN
jgi:hypothetical protein